ncbi:hypothetical protein [Bordetella sp. N]|uniref:hypothetical protein n=1 Tax=Bordetella sp. N TaxID=1746199 RepID=UPI0012E3D0E3|nr:hypothetical protein [Bordetella sp. N]
MPIETSQFHFSRELLPPDTFNEDPPPVPAAEQGGTATGVELDGIKMQVREGSEPGRARAALGRSRSEMRLDDPLPWNEVLSTIVDPGYATPHPKRIISRAAIDNGRAESPGLDDGRRSAPPGLPANGEPSQSMGGRTVSSVYLPGAGVWRAGTLMSPVVAERFIGSGRSSPGRFSRSSGYYSSSPYLTRHSSASSPGSNTPTLDRRVAQTAVFGDPAESALEISLGARIRRTWIRVWQGITYPPRKLVAVCQEWLRRYID